MTDGHVDLGREVLVYVNVSKVTGLITDYFLLTSFPIRCLVVSLRAGELVFCIVVPICQQGKS